MVSLFVLKPNSIFNYVYKRYGYFPKILKGFISIEQKAKYNDIW
tara:strand:+ start:738 stop:869 length:132 start_codon:yes stop_codon:yes gene_type:complete